MKNLEKQIRLKLVEYLLERDLSQLRAWIGPVTWDIDNSTDEDTKRLVYETSLLLDEWAYGHWTEDGFREEISKLIALSTLSTRVVFTTPVFAVASNFSFEVPVSLHGISSSRSSALQQHGAVESSYRQFVEASS